MKKIFIVLMLFFVLFIQGCAFQSVLFNTETERAGFVITRPPVQISYSGDITKDGQEFALTVLKQMQTEETNEYIFNENSNVSFSSMDAKSDEAMISITGLSQSNKDNTDGEDTWQ